MQSVERVGTFRFYILSALMFALSFFLLSNASAQTKTIIISDYDGTLTNDRQVDNGAFLTNIVLFRVEGQANILAPVPSGPNQVEITSQEFTRLKRYLAVDVNQQVTVHRTATLANGQKIRPGEYYFSPTYSYPYYMESQDPQRNFLLESQIRAEDTTRRQDRVGAHWQGKMWPVLTDYVGQKRADPNTHFMLLTARGHSVGEWLSWGRYLVSSGELSLQAGVATNADPLEARFIHNVSRPEYSVFSFMKGRPPHNDITQRKIGYLRQFLIDLMRVEPNEGERHQVVFADNDQHTIKEAYSLFQEFAFGGRLPADFTVINAGGSTEIDEMGLPAIATMDRKAVWKKTAQELMDRLGIQNYGKIRPPRVFDRVRTCSSMFIGGAL